MAINLGDAVVYIKYDDSALRGGITTSLNTVRGEVGGLTDFFTGSLQVAVGNLISGSITALGSAIATTAQGLTGFFAEGIKGAVDLDQQMSTIAALMGQTKEQVAPLKDLMYELALDPNLVVSATQAADAIQMLGSNGATVEQIMGGLAKSTIALANASGNDFALAADVASMAMGQFKIKAEESGAAFDSVVGVLNATKFSLKDYEQALANAGGVAAGMGVDLADLNTTLAATQSYFASGSEAGTSFKTFLQRLAQPTDDMRAIMNQYGISLYDASGKMKSMGEIAAQLNPIFNGTVTVTQTVGGVTKDMAKAAEEANEKIPKLTTSIGFQERELKMLQDQLFETQKWYAPNSQEVLKLQLAIDKKTNTVNESKAKLAEYQDALAGVANAHTVTTTSTKQLTEEEKNNIAITLGGADASRMVIALANTTTEEYAKLSEQVNASGNAFRTAATQVDSVQGAYDVFLGVIEAIQLQIGEAFLPALREMLIAFTDIADSAGPGMIAFGKVVAEVFAGLVADNIVPAIKGAADFIDTLAQIFEAQSLRTQFNILRDYIVENKDIFDGLFGAGFTDNLRAASDDIQRLIRIFSNEGLYGVMAQLLDMINNEFPTVGYVITNIIASVNGGLQFLSDSSNKVQSFINSFFDSMNIADQLNLSQFEAIGLEVLSAGDAIDKTFGEGTTGLILDFIGYIEELSKSIFDGFDMASQIMQLFNANLAMVSRNGGGYLDALSVTINQIGGIIDGVFGAGFSDKIQAFITAIINGDIGKSFEVIAKTIIKAFWDAIPQFVGIGSSIISYLFDGIVSTAQDLLPLAGDVISRILDALSVAIQGAATFGARIIFEIGNAIQSAAGSTETQAQMGTLGESIGKFIADGLKSLLSNAAELLPSLLLLAATIGRAVGQIVPGLIVLGGELAAGLVSGIVKSLTGVDLQVMTFNGFVAMFTNIAKQPMDLSFLFKSWLVTADILETIYSAGVGFSFALVDGLYTAITGNQDSLMKAGVDIMLGIVAGLNDAIDALDFVWDAIVLGFKQFFGIASPSTLFIELAGELVAGLVEGLSEYDDVLSAIEDMASEIVDTLSEYLADAGDGIADSVGEWADYFDGALSDILDIVDDVATALLDTIDGLLSDTLDNIASYTSDWYDTLNEFWTNAYDFASETISDLVDLVESWLDDKLSMMSDYADELYGAWEELWNDVSEYVSEVFNDINDLFSDFYDTASNLFNDLSDDLLGIWEDAWDTIGGILDGGVDAVSSGFNTLYAIGVTAFDSVRGVLTGLWDELWGTITSVAITSFNTLESWFNASKSFIESLWTELSIALEGAWVATWQLISSVFKSAKDSVMDEAGALYDDLVSKWDDIKVKLSGAWSELWNDLTAKLDEKAGDIIDGVKSAFEQMLKKAEEFKSKWIDTGLNIIDGLIEGMKRNEEKVTEYLKQLLKDALDRVKAAMGISSPSKVMADEVGAHIPTGVAMGVDDSAVAAFDAVGNMADGMLSVAREKLSNFGALGQFMTDSLTSTFNESMAGANMAAGVQAAVSANFGVSTDMLDTIMTQRIGDLGKMKLVTASSSAMAGRAAQSDADIQRIMAQLKQFQLDFVAQINSGVDPTAALAEFQAKTVQHQNDSIAYLQSTYAEEFEKISKSKDAFREFRALFKDAVRDVNDAASFAVTSADKVGEFLGVFDTGIEATAQQAKDAVQSTSLSVLESIRLLREDFQNEQKAMAAKDQVPVMSEWNAKFKETIMGGVEDNIKNMSTTVKTMLASGVDPQTVMDEYVKLSNQTFQLANNELAEGIPGVAAETEAALRESYRSVITAIDQTFINQTKAKLSGIGKDMKSSLAEGMSFQSTLDTIKAQFSEVEKTLDDKMIQGMPKTLANAQSLLSEEYKKIIDGLEKGLGSGIKDKLEAAKNTFNNALKSGLDPKAALSSYNETIAGLRSLLTEDVVATMPEASAAASQAITDASDKLMKSLEKDFIGGVKSKLGDAGNEFKQAIGNATSATQMAEIVSRFDYALADVQMGLKKGVGGLLPEAIEGAKGEIAKANEAAANDIARSFGKSLKDGLKGGLDDIKKGLIEGTDPALLMNNFNALVLEMQTQGDTVKRAIGTTFGQAIPKDLENMGVALQEQTDKAKELIHDFIEVGVKDKLKGIGEAFKKEVSEGGNVSNAMSQFKEVLAEVPAEFSGLAEDALDKAQQLAGKVLTSDIKDRLGALKADIKDLFEVGGTNQDAINKLKSSLSAVSDTITNELAVNSPAAVSDATELLQATTKDSARKIADNVFNDIKDTLKKAGQTVKDGLKDGLNPDQLLADFNDTVTQLGLNSEQLKTQLKDNFGIALPKELAGSGELISAELANVTKLVNEQVKKTQNEAGQSTIEDIKKSLSLAQSELKNTVDFGGTAEQAIGDFAIQLSKMGDVIMNELAITAPGKVAEANEILLSATRTAMRSLADASKKEFSELLTVEATAVKDSASDPARWAAFQDAMANQILSINKDVVAAVPGVVDEAQEIMVRKVATMLKVTTAEAEALLPEFLSKIETMKVAASEAPPIDIPNVSEAANQAAENWNNVMTGMLTSAKVNIEDLKTPIAALPEFLKTTATLMLESGNELDIAFSALLQAVGLTAQTEIANIVSTVSAMLDSGSETMLPLLEKATVLGSDFATALADGFDNGLTAMYNKLTQLQTDVSLAKAQLETIAVPPAVTSAMAAVAEPAASAVESVSNVVSEVINNTTSKKNDFNVVINNPIPQKSADDIMLLQALA